MPFCQSVERRQLESVWDDFNSGKLASERKQYPCWTENDRDEYFKKNNERMELIDQLSGEGFVFLMKHLQEGLRHQTASSGPLYAKACLATRQLALLAVIAALSYTVYLMPCDNRDHCFDKVAVGMTFASVSLILLSYILYHIQSYSADNRRFYDKNSSGMPEDHRQALGRLLNLLQELRRNNRRIDGDVSGWSNFNEMLAPGGIKDRTGDAVMAMQAMGLPKKETIAIFKRCLVGPSVSHGGDTSSSALLTHSDRDNGQSEYFKGIHRVATIDQLPDGRDIVFGQKLKETAALLISQARRQGVKDSLLLSRLSKDIQQDQQKIKQHMSQFRQNFSSDVTLMQHFVTRLLICASMGVALCFCAGINEALWNRPNKYKNMRKSEDDQNNGGSKLSNNQLAAQASSTQDVMIVLGAFVLSVTALCCQCYKYSLIIHLPALATQVTKPTSDTRSPPPLDFLIDSVRYKASMVYALMSDLGIGKNNNKGSIERESISRMITSQEKINYVRLCEYLKHMMILIDAIKTDTNVEINGRKRAKDPLYCDNYLFWMRYNGQKPEQIAASLFTQEGAAEELNVPTVPDSQGLEDFFRQALPDELHATTADENTVASASLQEAQAIFSANIDDNNHDKESDNNNPNSMPMAQVVDATPLGEQPHVGRGFCCC